jgi:hypothetical protein
MRSLFLETNLQYINQMNSLNFVVKQELQIYFNTSCKQFQMIVLPTGPGSQPSTNSFNNLHHVLLSQPDV